MRRLASQSRDDSYSSQQDYQELHEKEAQSVEFRDSGNAIVFEKKLSITSQGIRRTRVGFGGYIRLPEADKVELQLNVGGSIVNKTLELGGEWSRIGICIEVDLEGDVCVEASLICTSVTTFSFWGIDAGLVDETIFQQFSPALELLNAPHLVPETFYLAHDSVLSCDINEDRSSNFKLGHGDKILLKKCAYCQRFLAVDPSFRKPLSFHNHKSKKTGYQNECRSCKKWRINNSFNPIRTPDQLNESSVITRERKLLLREPEVLQAIKERTGRGLRSQVWERFNKRCFFCNDPVGLNDFQLDHTRPLAYLWPIDEYATCLCVDHNQQKKDLFPVDFYSENQLLRLSKITGLSLELLKVRDVCEPELARIINNISSFAREWDPRTFRSIQRRVHLVRPDIDLFEILKEADPEALRMIDSELKDRPDQISVD